ncbi:hypothetical protein [Sphingomonas insulae]|uniref:hypothetical protein n=1 Tax=Sphingomonas insulae TaxID=424800 RepID=UPI0013D53357|nr:hypothetical protein [Sphingomonas insulae]
MTQKQTFEAACPHPNFCRSFIMEAAGLEEPPKLNEAHGIGGCGSSAHGIANSHSRSSLCHLS